MNSKQLFNGCCLHEKIRKLDTMLILSTECYTLKSLQKQFEEL